MPKKKSADSIMSSIFDEFEKKDSKTTTTAKEEEETSKPADDTKHEDSQPVSIVSSIFDSVEKKKKEVKETKNDTAGENEEGKITITKVYDFAGESVE